MAECGSGRQVHRSEYVSADVVRTLWGVGFPSRSLWIGKAPLSFPGWSPECSLERWATPTPLTGDLRLAAKFPLNCTWGNGKTGWSFE
jgi:hypothetical protein